MNNLQQTLLVCIEFTGKKTTEQILLRSSKVAELKEYLKFLINLYEERITTNTKDKSLLYELAENDIIYCSD